MITRFSRVLHAAPDTPNAFIHDVSGLYNFLADTHRNDAIIQFSIPKVLLSPSPPLDIVRIGIGLLLACVGFKLGVTRCREWQWRE